MGRTRTAYVQVGCCQEVHHLMPVGEGGHLTGETLCGEEPPGHGWAIKGWVSAQGELIANACPECKKAYVGMRVVQET